MYSKAKLACYSRYLLTSYFCIPVPYVEKDIFFLVLVLEGLVGLIEPFTSASLALVVGAQSWITMILDHLDYLDYNVRNLHSYFLRHSVYQI